MLCPRIDPTPRYAPGSSGLLLGVFEPGSFTGGVKAVGEWFPMRDRALAIGIFNAGTALGSVAAAPLVSVMAVQWGWRSAFLVTGALGFVWLAPWMLFFKQPKHHPCLREEERQLILDGQDEETGKVRPPPLRRLLRMRETWGCVLVRALTDPISYFLLFWIPLYFQKQYDFDLKKLGMFLWIPYAAAALGNLAGGLIPRYLIGRGWELRSETCPTPTSATGPGIRDFSADRCAQVIAEIHAAG